MARIEDQQEMLKSTDDTEEYNDVKILTRKLLRAINFKDFFVTTEEGFFGRRVNNLTKEAVEKEAGFVNYIKENIRPNDLVDEEADKVIKRDLSLIQKELAINNLPITETKRADKGETKQFIFAGVLAILVPYAMGLALPWTAPLGIALIAAPFVVGLVSKIFTAIAEARINRIVNNIKELQLDDQNSRKAMQENEVKLAQEAKLREEQAVKEVGKDAVKDNEAKQEKTAPKKTVKKEAEETHTP